MDATYASQQVNLLATTMGEAAPFMLIVLNTSSSMVKCVRAARKEIRVAPAGHEHDVGPAGEHLAFG